MPRAVSAAQYFRQPMWQRVDNCVVERITRQTLGTELVGEFLVHIGKQVAINEAHFIANQAQDTIEHHHPVP